MPTKGRERARVFGGDRLFFGEIKMRVLALGVARRDVIPVPSSLHVAQSSAPRDDSIDVPRASPTALALSTTSPRGERNAACVPAEVGAARAVTVAPASKKSAVSVTARCPSEPIETPVILVGRVTA